MIQALSLAAPWLPETPSRSRRRPEQQAKIEFTTQLGTQFGTTAGQMVRDSMDTKKQQMKDLKKLLDSKKKSENLVDLRGCVFTKLMQVLC